MQMISAPWLLHHYWQQLVKVLHQGSVITEEGTEGLCVAQKAVAEKGGKPSPRGCCAL